MLTKLRLWQTRVGLSLLSCTVLQTTDRDLAQRHVRNCAIQGQGAVLPTLKRGRKRKSCDICSQRKLSCDAKMPCMRCRSGGTTCTYERLGLASSSVTSHIKDDVHPSHRESDNAEASASGSHGPIAIDFLLNFTDPSGYCPSAAVAAEAALLNIAEDGDNFRILQPYHLALYDQPFSDVDDLSSMFVRCPFLNSEGENTETTAVLEVRVSEMVSQLRAQHYSMQECDRGVQANFDGPLADFAFTVVNVRHLVRGFFGCFHNHFPILHEPTFDCQKASLPLLLTVVLFGSMSSNPSDVFISIRQFFGVAEAYVFGQLVSRQMLQSTQEAYNTKDDIELLQAGLLFLILQNNSNDQTTRRRIRLQRIPSLVAAVRASGLFAHKRRCLCASKDRPEWRDFISDEERPPHVAISEMTGDLPCGEDLFKAETALEFERAATVELPGLAAPSLSKLMSSLFLSPVSGSPSQVEEYVTAANMLVLVCALQSVIMTSRMNALASITVEPILRAVDRWKSLWDVVSQDSEGRSMSHKGFERHAIEYWWLARTLLKVGQSEDQSCRYMQCIPSDSAKDLHDFVCRYKDYVE
ncbi:hypothetical protein DL98DRAFT_610666 [Cadophora sp. DSE1049]|nr:hypothetical protein DL98DRAFT_610666 [Cadophora sp. DSE1049]